MRPRLLTPILAALGVLLTGCTATGTIDVRSETEVHADLVIQGADASCYLAEAIEGLTITGDGTGRCEVHGTLAPAVFNDSGIKLTRIGEELVMAIELPRRLAYVPIDILVRFPGEVSWASNGRLEGNGVRFSEPLGAGRFTGTRVSALDHVGPPWWVWTAGVGSLAGALLGSGILLLVRKRRRADDPDAGSDVEPAPDPMALGNRPVQTEPVDQSIWSRPG